MINQSIILSLGLASGSSFAFAQLAPPEWKLTTDESIESQEVVIIPAETKKHPAASRPLVLHIFRNEELITDESYNGYWI